MVGDGARKRFKIRGSKSSPRLETSNGEPFPTSCFAVANKGSDLEALGPWLVVDSARKRPDRDEWVLLHYSDFEDVYRKGYSVRQVRIGMEKTGGMFDREMWELGAERGEHITRLRPECNKFEAIGVVLEPGSSKLI
jgi:hypothetical protein